MAGAEGAGAAAGAAAARAALGGIKGQVVGTGPEGGSRSGWSAVAGAVAGKRLVGWQQRLAGWLAVAGAVVGKVVGTGPHCPSRMSCASLGLLSGRAPLMRHLAAATQSTLTHTPGGPQASSAGRGGAATQSAECGRTAGGPPPAAEQRPAVANEAPPVAEGEDERLAVTAIVG